MKDGRRVAVDIDLAEFFDTVNHDVLMSLLRRTIREQRCWACDPARPARRTAHLRLSEYYRPVPELDDWIRRRLRMCYWKQWRWVRTKIRNLLNLGVSLKTAIQHGVSSKSYWHMARTPALQQALSNAWLKAQGLVSVKDLWCKAQGYTT